MTLPTRRSLKPNIAIEHADYATILGNEFTVSTYVAKKPLYRVPISAPAIIPGRKIRTLKLAVIIFCGSVALELFIKGWIWC